MAAKLIFILGYVITIILILSKAQIISTNKNNQYLSLDVVDTDDNAATAALLHTNTTTAINAENKLINALHSHGDADFMQRTLHNVRPIDAEQQQQQQVQQNQQPQEKHRHLVQQEEKEESRKQLVLPSSMQQHEKQQHEKQQQQHQQRPTHNHVIQDVDETYVHSLLTQQNNNNNKFMNENEKQHQGNSTDNKKNIAAANAKVIQHNNNNNRTHRADDNDDSRKSDDEITFMPMKTIRYNVNDGDEKNPSAATNDDNSDAGVNERDGVNNGDVNTVKDSDIATKLNKTNNLGIEAGRSISSSSGDTSTIDAPTNINEQYRIIDANKEFSERSRYLETDLSLNDELPPSIEQTDDGYGDNNDHIDHPWSSNESKFEELTLNDDGIDTISSNTPRTFTTSSILAKQSRKPSAPTVVSTQNIYKITKSNKSKSIKRLAPPQSPQPLLEIRLNKSPTMSTTSGKQFINPKSFQHIANLYDQYQWNADDVRDVVSRKCASDMDVYLDALTRGKVWAAKASDASGRYRGQFLFGNNYWLGSLVICNELSNIDEMGLSFFIAATLIKSAEPLIKKHVLQVGQCLPQVCTVDDVKLILSMDDAAVKFNENYINATTDTDKGEITVINVRRVPGEYDIWSDRLFYLTICLCIAFAVLAIWATIYEHSLSMEHHMDDSIHPSPPPPTKIIQSMHAKSNGQSIYSYENRNHGNIHMDDVDGSDAAIKMDKIHANNILNGCTFELHPISMENNNEHPTSLMLMEKCQKNSISSSHNHAASNNNNNRALYRLNNTNGNGMGHNNNNRNGNSIIVNRSSGGGGNHNSNSHDNNHINHNNDHSNRIAVNKHNNNHDNINVSSARRETMVNSNAKQLGIPQRLLLSFGLSTNIKTILSAKKLPQDSVSCIHGIRVFSMMWTIMVHTYLQTFGISENRFSKVITERTFLYQIIGNATYTVDTFFFLSGFLVTLLFLRTKDSTKNSNESGMIAGTKQSVLLIIYRYVRLTPVYFVVIIINTVALKYVYNGSVFPPGLPDHLTCPNYWWRNILYIQTWFPFSQLCMLWSWYLADDMQFYIWAIVLLIFSKRYGKTAVAIIVTFLLTSWIVSALVSLHFNYMLKVSEPLESFGFLYEKPWSRLGPYVMGMFAGYILNRFKSPPNISPFINVIMWAMSICIMFLLVFGIWNGTLNTAWTAIYVSLGHTAWGFALIWITLSCKWGLAKPIDNLLSYRALLPLSRLTYCAYLIHPVTQIVMSFQLKGTMHIQHALVLTIFLGNAIISYVCALILSLLFEAPVVRMLKILFGK